MFHVGQKVVCVDAKGFKRRIAKPLRENAEYTIRDVGPELLRSGEYWVRVDEILNGIDPFFDEEIAYNAKRFRPIIKRKTDISIFKALLNPTKQTESV